MVLSSFGATNARTVLLHKIEAIYLKQRKLVKSQKASRSHLVELQQQVMTDAASQTSDD